MANDYTEELALYRQTDDICAFLNITSTAKSDVDNLAAKLAAFGAQANNTRGFVQNMFPTLVHQLVVAKCAYTFKWNQMQTQYFYNVSLVWEDKRGSIMPFWPWVILPSIFALISVAFNLSLVFVSAKNISFAKICNSLLLFDSICQIPVVLPFLINSAAFFLGILSLDYRICLATLMLSTGCSYASFLAIFLISLERLLIVTFPLRMNRMRASSIKFFSLLAFGLCLAFGLFMLLATFNVWTIINIPFYRSLLCNTGLYSDVLNTVTSYVLLLGAVLNYGLVLMAFLWHNRKQRVSGQQNWEANEQQEQSPHSTGTRRMLRSVFIISSLLLVGWLLGSAARNQLTNLIRAAVTAIVELFVKEPGLAGTISDNVNKVLVGLVTCLFVMAAGINAPTLICSNAQYKSAYKKTFCDLIGKKTSVGPFFSIS